MTSSSGAAINPALRGARSRWRACTSARRVRALARRSPSAAAARCARERRRSIPPPAASSRTCTPPWATRTARSATCARRSTRTAGARPLADLPRHPLPPGRALREAGLPQAIAELRRVLRANPAYPTPRCSSASPTARSAAPTRRPRSGSACSRATRARRRADVSPAGRLPLAHQQQAERAEPEHGAADERHRAAERAEPAPRQHADDVLGPE